MMITPAILSAPRCWRNSVLSPSVMFVSCGFLDMWDSKLDRMNERKKDRPYSFLESFILAVGCMRSYFHLPYRQAEGIIKAIGKSLPRHSSHGHICKRINN
jgi:hypothetical protein